MPTHYSRIFEFWKELRRRKVIHVVTVYAASAFVILELADILAPSLRLPDWTLNLVLLLLCVGFVIAVIVSWIYDIHPEGGIVKTEPVHKVKPEDIPKSSNSWKIASYISFVVIVGLIVLNIIPRTGREKVSDVLDKSIAVLPFESLSKDEELQYQADGVMDAIVLHLSKIEDLRVMSRTSVEQYRDTKKTIPEICEEMGVAYVLEGSFQKSGDQMRLIVQLIQSGTEEHVWANNYDREWKDIFIVQSEVAKAVASELQAVITPEEIDRIERPPTHNMVAYDFYQQAREEHLARQLEYKPREIDKDLERLYRTALRYDSTFASAYVGLARVYWDRNYYKSYYTEEFLDSVPILADFALSLDDQLAEGYTLKGDYCREKGDFEKAVVEYDKALDINPNDWQAFLGKGLIYSYLHDYISAFDNFLQAATLNQGPALASVYFYLGVEFGFAGFHEVHRAYLTRAFEQNYYSDTASYYYVLGLSYFMEGDMSTSLEYLLKAYSFNENDINNWGQIGLNYSWLGHKEEALEFYQKYIDTIEEMGQFDYNATFRIGYTYYINGMEEKANYYFDKQIEFNKKSNELGRPYSRSMQSYKDLAAIYAVRGEKEKALENLRIYNSNKHQDCLGLFLESDPLYDNIRDDPEFQQILLEVKANYQKEHERVRQWLEENDIL